MAERGEEDRIYREGLAVSGLIDEIPELAGTTFDHLVDLGCRDGSVAKALVKGLGRTDLTVTLFDEGKRCHGISDESPEIEINGRRVKVREGELDDLIGREVRGGRERDSWLSAFAPKTCLWVSTYTIEDLPNVSDFFYSLKVLMKPGEWFFLVCVHPAHAEELMRGGFAPAMGFGSIKDDFRYALRLPIAGGKKRPFFIPYFQRTFEDYSRLASAYGLVCRGGEHPYLPRTDENERRFASTIYADNSPSALLLAFERPSDRP